MRPYHYARNAKPELIRRPRDADRRRKAVYHLQTRRAALGRGKRRAAAAVLAQDPAREPAPERRRRVREESRRGSVGSMGRESQDRARDRLSDRSRAAAGFHRRPG